MSSSNSTSNPNQIIEHVVLYKTKRDAHPSAISAMLTNLYTLASLPSVLHLSAAPVSGCRSDSLTFTHMLHTRYRSKPDLVSYSHNPTHINVVANYVKPVVDDVMAVDWVVDDFSGSPVVPSGSAMRLTILKLKEGARESEKREVMEIVRSVPTIVKLTMGENFSPGRAKGYSICSIEVLEGQKELEAVEVVNEQKDKVMEFVDGFVVLDYFVPPSIRSSSL